jgi:hypothetical protein
LRDRAKKKKVDLEKPVNRRLLGLTSLLYSVLFAVIGVAFGNLVLYDFVLSKKLAIPLLTWIPHYSFTTSVLLGVALSEFILWPLLLLKPDWF